MSPQPFSLRQLTVPFYIPGFFWSAGAGAILPVLPLYIRSLGADLSITGVSMAMFAIGALFGNIPAGIVISRIGKKRAMTGAVLFEVVIAGAAAVVHTPYQLMPLLFALGSMHTLFFLARLTYFRELVPRGRRGRALSILGGENRLGSTIGPVLGGLAADSFGLRAAFVVLGIFSLIVSVFAVAFLPKDSHGPRGFLRRSGVSAQSGTLAASNTPGTITATGPRTLSRMLTILREQRQVFATAGLAVLTLKLIREARKVIFPLWGDYIGMSSSAIGVLFGLAHAVELALFYPAGTIMDRWGRKKTAVPCLLLFSLGFLLLPIARTPVLFILLAVIVSIGNGIGAGINMTLSTDMAPLGRTVEFLVVWRTITDIGGAAGPLVIGFVSAALSLSAAAPVMGLVGLSGAGIMAFTVRETLDKRSNTLEA